MLVGFAYTYVGLVLFLCGVNVGFGPVGTVLGRELARSGHKWLLVPIGMLIGFFIVKAEPAIQVLNRQIQGVTNGAISAQGDEPMPVHRRGGQRRVWRCCAW